jgi:hypothetical protein
MSNSPEIPQRPKIGTRVVVLPGLRWEGRDAPRAYVQWAQTKAAEHGAHFSGIAEQVMMMIETRKNQYGDIFLDYEVEGDTLEKKGLSALFNEIQRAPNVSHVQIIRRSFIAAGRRHRWIAVGKKYTCIGSAYCLFGSSAAAVKARSTTGYIVNVIVAALDFQRGKKELFDLADKMVQAKRRVAMLGFATGGRPPSGFRRWLVRQDGTRVRELVDNEKVKTPGHHIAWLPRPEASFHSSIGSWRCWKLHRQAKWPRP